MLVRLKNVIFLILLLKMCVIFGQGGEHQKRIITDVGHGGKDPGAIGLNGILEKDVVLAIGIEMIRLNKLLLGNEYDIFLTRYDDSFYSLSERVSLAKSLRGDIFISLHCNSFYSNARGMEIYTVHPELEEFEINTRTSIALGNEILRESSNKINIKTRGMKFANFQVLREIIKNGPAVLIEVGFLNDRVEAVYFSESPEIRAMALSILMGIYNYLKKE